MFGAARKKVLSEILSELENELVALEREMRVAAKNDLEAELKNLELEYRILRRFASIIAHKMV